MSVAGCARAAGVGSGERGMHLRRSRQFPPTSVARSFAKQSRKRVRENCEAAPRDGPPVRGEGGGCGRRAEAGGGAVEGGIPKFAYCRIWVK